MKHNYKTQNPLAPFVDKNGEIFERTNKYTVNGEEIIVENVYLSQPEFTVLCRLCNRNDLDIINVLFDVDDFIEMEWDKSTPPLGYSMVKHFIKNQIKWRAN